MDAVRPAVPRAVPGHTASAAGRHCRPGRTRDLDATLPAPTGT
ncbi:hypothetical protein [Streptomyces sp. CBMA123]|nr:hypothetical protein [Streptomyces sp. CBMA123]